MYENISKQIYYYRNIKKVSIDQLSEVTGLSSRYLKSIEKNSRKPSLLTIEKIAKALNINITNLICEEEEFWNLWRRGILKKVEIFLKM